jgi:branched-chain amino acid transport system permease protein
MTRASTLADRNLVRGAVVPLGAVIFFLASANQYQVTVGSTVGIDAIAALGLTLVVGRAGQLALGQAGFMAVGAYVVGYGTTKLSIPFLLAVLIGIAISAGVGLVVGYIALRLRGNYLGMATLAFGAIIDGLLQINGALGGSGGLYGIPPITLFGAQITSPAANYLVTWVVAVIVLILCGLYLRSRAGQELQAMRDDELAARALGINVTARKLQAFALSAVFGSLAGALLAATTTTIDPTLFTPLISFQLFLMVVIGGLGSLPGAVAGAGIVVWIVQLTPGTGDAAYVALGFVVIVLMTFVPNGIAGACDWVLKRGRRRRRVDQQPPRADIVAPEADPPANVEPGAAR